MFIVEILEEVLVLYIEMAPYLLLGLLFVGMLNIWITKDLVAKHIGKSNIWSVLKASLFGIPLPLCSCGVVPSAVYMSKNGASKSSVVSFLISTPQTGIDSIIATYGMMGWVFAIFRPFAALFMGVFGGILINYLDKNDSNEKKLDFSEYSSNEDSCNDSCCSEDSCEDDSCETTQKPNKLKRFLNYSFVEFLDDISVQFVIGLLISGLIAYFVPAGFFENSSVNSGVLGMLLMIAVGVPMYICATASIPIAVTLMLKGFSPGVAFVFLAVGPATNAASLTIISNVLGKKITVFYVGIISISAIVFGLILDRIFELLDLNQTQILTHIHEHGDIITEELKWFFSILFGIALVLSLYRKLLRSKFKKKEVTMDTTTIKVEGMNCNHCVANVRKAIEEVNGVEEIEISLEREEAYIKGNFEIKDVEESISKQGYKIIK